MWEEIYESMSRNKLRIALTGFSIAWGIFMLIVLLGAGNGLLNGVMSTFASQAINSVQLWPGHTSEEYNGLPRNREIYFDEMDVEYLRAKFPREIAQIQATVSASVTISNGIYHMSSTTDGVYPDYIASGDYKLLEGRFINDMDIRERRKVCMLHEKALEKLGNVKLGEYVKIADIPFLVVGIYKGSQNFREEPPVLPLTTLCTIFQPNGHYSELKLLVKNLETEEENKAFSDSLEHAHAYFRQYSPTDQSALWMHNSWREYQQTQTIFNGLRIFIWLIGLATLIAGVTGISNIMLITVRERTREFGIRKALGAKPRQIVMLVILESVAITLLFGYIGMLAGIGLTQLIDLILVGAQGVDTGDGESFSIFQNPTVDMGIVVMATLVMVVAGVIAGYIPAKRAVSIKPVEALAAT